MTSFSIILSIAATTAFLFRFLPFMSRRLAILNNPDSNLFRFLSYSSQAMLGVLAFELVFGEITAIAFVRIFSWDEAVSLGLLVIAFVVTVRTRMVTLVTALTLLFYLLYQLTAH